MYTANIISFLAAPKLQLAVNSIEELAYNSRLQVVVEKGNIFESVLMVKTKLIIYKLTQK